MGRPRQSAQVIKLKGADKKDPQRYRDLDKEPKPLKAIGKPPKNLTESESGCWAELVDMIPPGVLFNTDRWVAEAACRLMAKFRADWLSGAEMGSLVALMARMGMSPSDRSKIKVEPPKEVNPYDGM